MYYRSLSIALADFLFIQTSVIANGYAGYN
jgi:hypothetical protein